jgi:hypothetical protein
LRGRAGGVRGGASIPGRRSQRPAGPKLPLLDPKGTSPREFWDDYFSKRQPHPRVINELILELHKAKKHEQVIAVIEAALAAGQGQPWMYDVMVGSMQIVKRPQAEINRVLASRIDLTAGDVDSMVYTAAYFVRLGGHELALRLYRQASRINPTRPEPYVLGLKLARDRKDYEAVKWAATGILVTAWMRNHAELHKQAEAAAADAVRELNKAGRGKEAAELTAAMAAARKRDLVLKLEWAGTGDLDLIVEEPPGTVCSAGQPQTANGGVLLHDGFGPEQDNCYEEYVCAMGRPGKYRVRIRHVYGNIVGKRAVLTVTRHLGTADETVRRFPVQLGESDRIIRLSLPGGRRTTLAVVPPKDEQFAGGKRIPRLRRIFSESAGGRRAARQFAASRRMLSGARRPGFQPVISNLSEGVSLTTMALVSGDRRYVRIGVNPRFTNITDVFTFSFVNSGNPTGGGVGGGGGGTRRRYRRRSRPGGRCATVRSGSGVENSKLRRKTSSSGGNLRRRNFEFSTSDPCSPPHQSRNDVGLQVGGHAAIQHFPGNARHRGVVGAHGWRRDQQFHVAFVREFPQPFPQPAVGGDAAADAQRLPSELPKRQIAFRDQHVDRRLLKRRGHVGQPLFRQSDPDAPGVRVAGQRRTAPWRPAHGVQHGGLQPAEAEIEPVFADERPREIECGRVAAARELLDRRSPRIRQPEHLGDLVERFADGVVDRGADQPQLDGSFAVVQVRVSPADDEADRGKHVAPGGHPAGVDVGGNVIHADERDSQHRRQSLRRRQPHQQRADQPRLHGNGDGGEVGKLHVRLSQRFIDDGQNPPHVGAGRDLGNDAPEPRVQIVLRGDDAGVDVQPTINHRRRGFVAGGFDGEQDV